MWNAEPINDTGGYDCMTAAIAVTSNGRRIATLDGADYGQAHCTPLGEDAHAAMTWNAELIADAPALLALARTLAAIPSGRYDSAYDVIDTADLAKLKAEARALTRRHADWRPV